MAGRPDARPTPRIALITGKAFGASVRAIAQAIAVFALSAILQVHLDWNPLRLLMTLVVIVLGSAFFSTLSMTIAGIVLSRERLMGIGQRSRCLFSSPPTPSTPSS